MHKSDLLLVLLLFSPVLLLIGGAAWTMFSMSSDCAAKHCTPPMQPRVIRAECVCVEQAR